MKYLLYVVLLTQSLQLIAGARVPTGIDQLVLSNAFVASTSLAVLAGEGASSVLADLTGKTTEKFSSIIMTDLIRDLPTHPSKIARDALSEEAKRNEKPNSFFVGHIAEYPDGRKTETALVLRQLPEKESVGEAFLIVSGIRAKFITGTWRVFKGGPRREGRRYEVVFEKAGPTDDPLTVNVLVTGTFSNGEYGSEPGSATIEPEVSISGGNKYATNQIISYTGGNVPDRTLEQLTDGWQSYSQTSLDTSWDEIIRTLSSLFGKVEQIDSSHWDGLVIPDGYSKGPGVGYAEGRY